MPRKANRATMDTTIIAAHVKNNASARTMRCVVLILCPGWITDLRMGGSDESEVIPDGIFLEVRAEHVREKGCRKGVVSALGNGLTWPTDRPLAAGDSVLGGRQRVGAVLDAHGDELGIVEEGETEVRHRAGRLADGVDDGLAVVLFGGARGELAVVAVEQIVGHVLAGAGAFGAVDEHDLLVVTAELGPVLRRPVEDALHLLLGQGFEAAWALGIRGDAEGLNGDGRLHRVAAIEARLLLVGELDVAHADIEAALADTRAASAGATRGDGDLDVLVDALKAFGGLVDQRLEG